MKRLIFIGIFFFFAQSLLSAPQTKPKNLIEQSQNEQKPAQLSDEERDAMLITSGMGILTAVVSIFVDRHNIPHVKTQLFALLAGLQQFVSYMVRTPLSTEQEEVIVEQLLALLEQVWMLKNNQ